MKSDDLMTKEELRASLRSSSNKILESANAELAALDDDSVSFEDDVSAQATEAVVAVAPALDGIVMNTAKVPSVGDEPGYEGRFRSSQRDLMMSIANGIDGASAVVLEEAVSVIDDIRSIMDDISSEAAQISLLSASGYLVPPSAEDVEDYRDEVEEARSQAIVTRNELSNLRARRRAQAIASGEIDQDDLFPKAASIGGRPLAAGVGDNEEGVDVTPLVQGSPSTSRAQAANDQAEMLQELLRAPILKRIHYVAICAAVDAMNRAKSSRADSLKAKDRLVAIYDNLRGILSGDFLSDIKDNLEASAEKSAASVVDLLQEKLDAVDEFTSAVARLPGPFVSTVKSIGDEPDRGPIINSLASICGLKSQRFCELQGLIEIAASIDSDLGLVAPKLPMIGRAVFVLDEPDDTQIEHHVTVPGQEADLILIAGSGSVLTAMFSRATAPLEFSSGGSFTERGNVFGDGPGTITVIGNGSAVDVEIDYDSVTWSAGVYTFSLSSPLPAPIVPTVKGESDSVVLTGLTSAAPGAEVTTPAQSWNNTIDFEPGASVVTMRAVDTEARDIVTPCDLALGFGESLSVVGQYDASVANKITAITGSPFASWMVGLSIDLGPASGQGVGERRVINSFIDEENVTYAGANVPAHLALSRAAFRFTVDQFEVVRANSVVAGPHPNLLSFSLAATTSKPHARLKAIAQLGVRVVPAVRDENLDESLTPASSSVRDGGVLPAGSFIVKATYQDVNQDAFFTPVIIGKATGKLFINGQGPLAYTSVADESGPSLSFTLSTATTSAFRTGDTVEVETTSLLDDFNVQFPLSWFDPIDLALANIGERLNRIEAKFCRILSGSGQSVAADANQLSLDAAAVSAQLTLAKFALLAWIVPMVKSQSMTRAIESLEDIGAFEAVDAVKTGQIGRAVAMEPAEGTAHGSAMVSALSYRDSIETEEEYNTVSRIVAINKARHDASIRAASITDDIEKAQREDIEDKLEAAKNLDALQEKL